LFVVHARWLLIVAVVLGLVLKIKNSFDAETKTNKRDNAAGKHRGKINK